MSNSLWLSFSRQNHPLYPNIELTFVEGKGSYLIDSMGKKYFDAFSTLWTNLVGHGRDEIADAMATQTKKLSFMHLFTGSQHLPAQNLADSLIKKSPFGHSHCFFGLSGSDATECAIKMARQYWFNKGKPQKNIIVGRKITYHGTSYGALSLMGHDSYQVPFGPLVDRIHRVSPNSKEEIENYFDAINASENVAAVLIEPVITSDELILPSAGYFSFLQDLCRKHNVLLIVDEVSTGMGRTGELYGSTLFNLKPDIVYLAKSLTSGYAPLSAVMTSNEIFKVINSDGRFFMHGSTFAGHPVSCVAASKVLEIVERENLVEKAKSLAAVLGSELKKNLADLDCIESINGAGTLWHITLKGFSSAKEVELGMRLHSTLLNEGQYIRVLGRYLCIAPPLIAKSSEIEEMAQTIRKVLTKIRTEKDIWG